MIVLVSKTFSNLINILKYIFHWVCEILIITNPLLCFKMKDKGKYQSFHYLSYLMVYQYPFLL